MDVDITTCTGCGEERWDSDLHGPCPHCNGTGYTLHGGFRNQVLTMNNRGIVLEYGTVFAWQEQWANVRDLLKELEKFYQPGNFPGARTVNRTIRYYFIECFHLGDWLWEDTATTLIRSDVSPFILADPALKYCEAMANTTKHHTRDKPTKMSAWVHSVTHNQGIDAADALIEWKTDKDTGQLDALKLAKDCYTAWRDFQKTKGLKTLLPT